MEKGMPVSFAGLVLVDSLARQFCLSGMIKKEI